MRKRMEEEERLLRWAYKEKERTTGMGGEGENDGRESIKSSQF